MHDWALVTGGGTGIGRALALELGRRGLRVLIAGRRQEPLEQTRAQGGEAIVPVCADIGTEQGRELLARALPAGARLRCLVHNAGVLMPVGPLAEVSLHDWRQNQSVNVEGPLFLTQALLPSLEDARVLHISSGAAHHGYRGWGAYCTAKAALYMLYQVLRDELAEQRVAVGSLRPGVVDTPMQALVREQDEKRFPAVGRFIELERSGQLIDPQELARFTAWLLLECEAAEFSRQEWDFTDPGHRARCPT